MKVLSFYLSLLILITVVTIAVPSKGQNQSPDILKCSLALADIPHHYFDMGKDKHPFEFTSIRGYNFDKTSGDRESVSIVKATRAGHKGFYAITKTNVYFFEVLDVDIKKALDAVAQNKESDKDAIVVRTHLDGFKAFDLTAPEPQDHSDSPAYSHYYYDGVHLGLVSTPNSNDRIGAVIQPNLEYKNSASDDAEVMKILRANFNAANDIAAQVKSARDTYSWYEKFAAKYDTVTAQETMKKARDNFQKLVQEMEPEKKKLNAIARICGFPTMEENSKIEPVSKGSTTK